MRQFTFNPTVYIPENRVSDVIKLRDFIVNSMDIQISLVDSYRLWSEISDKWDAGWLSFDFDDWNYDESPWEFLEKYMNEFGYIIDK